MIEFILGMVTGVVLIIVVGFCLFLYLITKQGSFGG